MAQPAVIGNASRKRWVEANVSRDLRLVHERDIALLSLRTDSMDSLPDCNFDRLPWFVVLFRFHANWDFRDSQVGFGEGVWSVILKTSISFTVKSIPLRTR
jgi:hypothetical protein